MCNITVNSPKTYFANFTQNTIHCGGYVCDHCCWCLKIVSKIPDTQTQQTNVRPNRPTPCPITATLTHLPNTDRYTSQHITDITLRPHNSRHSAHTSPDKNHIKTTVQREHTV